MKMTRILPVVASVLLAAMIQPALAQTTYQPKFRGDPARSDSEAAALGYLRTFLRAQKIYKKKNDHYATSLQDLAKTGSFTRRMVSTARGDYTVKFTPHKEKDTFEILMVPKQLDSTHRSFFAKVEGTNRRDDGAIRADDQKEADEHSPVLKADAMGPIGHFKDGRGRPSLQKHMSVEGRASSPVHNESQPESRSSSLAPDESLSPCHRES